MEGQQTNLSFQWDEKRWVERETFLVEENVRLKAEVEQLQVRLAEQGELTEKYGSGWRQQTTEIERLHGIIRAFRTGHCENCAKRTPMSANIPGCHDQDGLMVPCQALYWLRHHGGEDAEKALRGEV
jgi:thymidylate synthase